MRVVLRALVIAALTGCGPSTSKLDVAPPDTTGFVSMIAVLEAPNAIRAVASLIADAKPIIFPDARPGDRLHVLLYAQPLGELAVPKGELVANPSNGITLPAGSTDYVGTVDSRFSGWSKEAALPSSVSSFEFTQADFCPSFDITPMTEPSLEGVIAMATLDMNTVLSTGMCNQGPIFRIQNGALSELTISSTQCPTALFARGDGSLWIGTNDGRIGTIDPASGTVSLLTGTPIRPGETVFGLDGSPAGQALELWVATSSGTLARLDGSGWTAWPGLGRKIRDTANVPHVRWVEPGRAVYIDRTPTVRLIHGSQIIESAPVAGELGSAVINAVRTASGRIILGANSATGVALFELRATDEIVPLSTAPGPEPSYARTMTAVSSGVMYADSKGSGVYYDLIHGPCIPQPLAPFGGAINVLISASTDAVAYGGDTVRGGGTMTPIYTARLKF
jgi:hypothetical protein